MIHILSDLVDCQPNKQKRVSVISNNAHLWFTRRSPIQPRPRGCNKIGSTQRTLHGRRGLVNISNEAACVELVFALGRARVGIPNLFRTNGTELGTSLHFSHMSSGRQQLCIEYILNGFY